MNWKTQITQFERILLLSFYGFCCFMAGRQEGRNQILKLLNTKIKISQDDTSRTN